IKPSNLMVTANGRVIVMDLGIAKAIDTEGVSLTGAYSAVPATLQYAAPEQLAGDRPVDGRTDLYALGATLYLLLAGQPPFRGPARTDPAPLEQLRPETRGALADLVKRALAFDPDDRFPSAASMFAALRPFAPADLRVAVPASTSTSSPSPSSSPSASPSSSSARPSAGDAPPASRRRATLLVVGGVLVVVALGLVAAALALSRPAAPSEPTPSAQAVAPASWPVLKAELTDMSYTGDDTFATWTSNLA